MIPRRIRNSNLEIHKRSHVAGVLRPPMHLPKAPPTKIGSYEGFLTTMVPWESPEQAVTNCAHKKYENNPKLILVRNARLMSMKLEGGYLGGCEPWHVHHYGKEMKCKYVDAQKYA